MMRRIQKKDYQEKKVIEKAALKAAADSESKPQHVDLEELERIRKRQAGHPVTVETFDKWKKAFQEDLERQKMENISADDFKLTGKQFFLMQKEKGIIEDESGIEDLIMEGEQEEISEDNVLLDMEGDEDDDEDYVEGEESEDDDENDEEDYEEEEPTKNKASNNNNNNNSKNVKKPSGKAK
jgi:hypothetical protein